MMENILDIKIQVKQNIQDHLPYGGLSKIKKAVEENYGRIVSVTHVKNVCSPDHNSWDADVISEAQKLVIATNSSIINAKENMV